MPERIPLEHVELECLRLLAAGKTHAQIPNLLRISRATMYRAFKAARTKLKADTDEHAVHLATKHGLI